MARKAPPFPYHPFFCEENIWHACQAACFAGERIRVVVIGNELHKTPVCHQRLGDGKPIVWDYHVVLLVGEDAPRIWDPDTSLPFPCEATTYLRQSFPGDAPPEHWPLFRLIEGDEYLRIFSSDRGHMLAPNGEPLLPFPPWPAIVRGENALPKLLAWQETAGPGTVFSLDELLASIPPAS